MVHNRAVDLWLNSALHKAQQTLQLFFMRQCVRNLHLNINSGSFLIHKKLLISVIISVISISHNGLQHMGLSLLNENALIYQKNNPRPG